jgi:hypothetical protein
MLRPTITQKAKLPSCLNITPQCGKEGVEVTIYPAQHRRAISCFCRPCARGKGSVPTGQEPEWSASCGHCNRCNESHCVIQSQQKLQQLLSSLPLSDLNRQMLSKLSDKEFTKIRWAIRVFCTRRQSKTKNLKGVRRQAVCEHCYMQWHLTVYIYTVTSEHT